MNVGRKCWMVLLLGVALVGFVTSGCGPKYPNCDKDKDCKTSDQGKKEGKLYCVNGKCQECRTDKNCGDPSMECNAGVCEKIPNYCASDADCSGNQVCRENRCGPECLSDDDCDEGFVCKGGSCEKEPECSTDADCSGNEVCESGQCVAPPEPPKCSLDTVYFAFDSAALSSTARDKLQANADCIKERGESVELEGHCDERGNNEYNIALGERRANSVEDYLESLGVSSGNLSTISYGEERHARKCGIDKPDTCQEENRRVEFDWE